MKEGSCWCVTAYHNERLTKASNIINCSRINLANQAYKAETEGVTHHATVPLRLAQNNMVYSMLHHHILRVIANRI